MEAEEAPTATPETDRTPTEPTTPNRRRRRPHLRPMETDTPTAISIPGTIRRPAPSRRHTHRQPKASHSHTDDHHDHRDHSIKGLPLLTISGRQIARMRCRGVEVSACLFLHPPGAHGGGDRASTTPGTDRTPTEPTTPNRRRGRPHLRPMETDISRSPKPRKNPPFKTPFSGAGNSGNNPSRAYTPYTIPFFYIFLLNTFTKQFSVFTYYARVKV